MKYGSRSLPDDQEADRKEVEENPCVIVDLPYEPRFEPTAEYHRLRTEMLKITLAQSQRAYNHDTMRGNHKK